MLSQLRDSAGIAPNFSQLSQIGCMYGEQFRTDYSIVGAGYQMSRKYDNAEFVR
jgi:hypothetical protein